MKSSALIILASLLAIAILAPSIVTLSNLGEKTAIAIDFSDEEKKEEKKEGKKDFFLEYNLNSLAGLQDENKSISSYYLESDYFSPLGILLPPPKHTSS